MSNLSDAELRQRIKQLEAQGKTGVTDSELDALNREQTGRLSDDDLVSLIKSRASQGKPIGKLAAAAKARNLSF
ncbi:MAG: hypothetical protein COX36_03210 [Candidatus Nealsonbacteria bacterium CG23_combo_of_CG06-09_8_20_14_all_38_19]|uniref:Uncharacterized protein n=1 Tax=Candidatus Nealsonbacteria bacterium CG23_combo_of_CG06-09_8_20_14_all_38_19 TaxID=1974721 RepID=A0A2G9YW40_9BACT|nr:MAG: hypothetical protein COX36_03210 [Candidatus Nealsonbacteria bacterium CG23_combo_of_CG06-09_8_20_14_all_38_19]